MADTISMMTAFSDRLEQQMQEDPLIRVLTADLVGSCALKKIEKNHPDQFINVGIAEQNMVGIAAGLASEGMRPYTYTFAAFHSMRACEQIRTDVLYNKLNVKIIGTHSGVSTGQGGSTHFSLEDIGIIRSMPQSVILVPSDPVSAAKTADVIYLHQGGVYVRLDRNPLPLIYAESDTFAIGKANILAEGSDLVIFAIGTAVSTALEVVPIIQEKTGKSVAVVDIYSVKPLDRDCVLGYLKRCSLAFTVEEHNTCCGLFGAVAECSATETDTCRIFPIGITETYPHGNPVPRAKEVAGLTPSRIVEQILSILEQQERSMHYEL